MALSEKDFAKETLERYSGSSVEDFRKKLLLTNFPKYLDFFAALRSVPVVEGSAFRVAHDPVTDTSMVDFKIGSPAAALVVDLCAFLPVDVAMFLGMCGGLRRRYRVGEYLVPVASIRGDGASDFYWPPYVPALANFLMQKATTEILEESKSIYHVGITFTSSIRFWEYNEDFKAKLMASRAQGIEMECATLFSASYKNRLTLGALLLISDMPLDPDGVKTNDGVAQLYQAYMPDHVQKGIAILDLAHEMLKRNVKGYYHRENDELRAARRRR